MRTHAFIKPSIILACSLLTFTAAGQCPDIPGNPADDIEGASFGYATAISADGSVALVSGPGFDLGDGLVRTFERVGTDWIEGTALGAVLQFGDNFGWSIAMNDAGTRVVITAPREPAFAPSFFLASGGVYIYERDEMTGDWSQTHRWEDPTPGTEFNFGASCDITPDGNTVVIGRANVLGSESSSLPDAAYVCTFDKGVWGPLIQLVPTTSIPNGYNFGEQITISDDGTLIAVGAPKAPAFTPESGIVVVFENQSDVWVQTDTLTRPSDGSFNNFGAAIEFDGHTLLTINPTEETLSPNGDLSAPICIYERGASSYPSTPSELLYQSSASPPTGEMVVRNNTLVVGKYISSFGSGFGVTRYTRETEDPSRMWKFDARFVGDLESNTQTRFGHSVAIADNPEIMVIGEPSWSNPLSGVFNEGRINFPNRTFTNSDFVVESGLSSMQISFDFPGLQTQTLFIQLLGFFNLSFPENCSGSPIPTQAVIESFELMPDSPEYTLDGPLGSTIRLTEVVISLVAPSDPAPITGQQAFTGMTVQVDAMVKIGILPAFPFSAQGDQSEPMVTQLTGGYFGEPLRFSIPQLGLDFEPDLGLGANNPTISGVGSVASTGPTAKVCLADLNLDGELDFIDISAFLSAYTNLDPLADLNDDFEYDFLDISAFLSSYSAGCP